MNFILTKKQTDFVGAPEQFVAYVGAIGTGKSTSLIVKALAHSQETPGNLGVIVRKNFTDLRDSTIKDFETYTGFRVSEQKKECVLPNGSVILFRHGDELPVLKNLNLGFFGMEQAEEFPDATAWHFLQMRLRRKCAHRNGFFVANTNGHNWIYDLFKKNGPPKNHLLIEATTLEHADILPADYIENLKLTMPKKLYNRYVMNSWEEAEGLVYDEYLEARHVIDPFQIPETWERGFGLDHGFRNPTAVLWYAIDHDENVYIIDEHYEKEKPISEHAQAIKERGLYDGIADPSIFAQNQQKQGKVYSIADEYLDCGITLRPAVRSKEEASIARVNEFFKADRLKIFKNCVNTKHEVENWKWKAVRPTLQNANLPEEPEDKNNHAADVIKYVIASRFSTGERPRTRPEHQSLSWYENHMEQLARIKEKDKPIW
jgi:phage terminase large subunit